MYGFLLIMLPSNITCFLILPLDNTVSYTVLYTHDEHATKQRL